MKIPKRYRLVFRSSRDDRPVITEFCSDSRREAERHARDIIRRRSVSEDLEPRELLIVVRGYNFEDIPGRKAAEAFLFFFIPKILGN